MAAMAMATMGTTARGPLMLSLRLMPMLSPAMVTTDTVTGTALTDTAMAMDMEDTEATTTARDLPMLSPAMVTMVMVMEDTEEVITVTAMVTVMVTMVMVMEDTEEVIT